MRFRLRLSDWTNKNWLLVQSIDWRRLTREVYSQTDTFLQVHFFWRPRVFTCKCDEISPAEEACRKKNSSKPIVDDQIWQFSRGHKKMRHLLIRHHCRRAASNNEEYRCMNKLSYDVVIYNFLFPFSFLRWHRIGN